MKRLFSGICLAVVALIGIAAAVLLPPPQALRTDGVYERIGERIHYESDIFVIVTGPNISSPGTYSVSYDSTYKEVFALAGANGYEEYFAPDAKISMEDAVLIGGHYYIYLVV